MPDNTEVAATTAGIGAQYDSNHAYFLHSSDAPVLDSWTNLEERFGHSNGAKLFHLQKELNDLMQGTNDIAGYYTKIKNCACMCGGKKKLVKSLEDERLIQFLMGLNETYAQARSNILMIKPLPFVNHAYFRLLQDENQRETPVYNQFSSGSSSFMAGSQGYSMPNGNQFNKSKKFQGPIRENAATSGEEQQPMEIDGVNLTQNLSKDQFSQLVNLLKQVKVHQDTSTGTRADISANVAAGIAFNNLVSGFLMKRPQAFGEVKEGLYLLRPCSTQSRNFFQSNVYLLSNVNNSVLVSSTIFQSNVSLLFKENNLVSVSVSSAKLVSDVMLWHNRLGHLPFHAMKNIIDVFSRATWTYLLTAKSNVFSVLQHFLKMVERQFDVKVKVIRSDNAMELGEGSVHFEYLISQGILHQTSCVAAHQQNRVVERKHKHLLEIARALMFQSKVPTACWGECVLTATHMINRIPSRVIKVKTPYEVIFGELPDYIVLRTFSCLCYVSTLAQNRGKFEPRAKACMFLGYPPGQKGYKLLELDNKNIVVSRDVQFHETNFPFHNQAPKPHNIFPTPPGSQIFKILKPSLTNITCS
ncbi:uncharacterized protein LOC142179326 [Nicotiana tabacum]|uniref:Uncharacterized protein LOC142179326 n=1 Tax=Nicotiana tabacum TaxID=4097 RepID=A0AC58U6L9_TOBAC